MNSKPEISEAEYQVMKSIWSAGVPLNTNEVVEKLETFTSWKPKTIHTLLSRLVKKGALQYKKDGRVFVYTPLVKESDILAKENDNFLNRFYNGALGSMIVSLLEQDKLSGDDILALRKILDEKLSDLPQTEPAVRPCSMERR
ncbi:MAG: BlaI/MecI/CopY family transcriptional regulator [Defluviitaleaceae bacterium]|nr:BlaI/MecI/CopY family transcriptional regulator [Defluviitaleaceae bacterium]